MVTNNNSINNTVGYTNLGATNTLTIQNKDNSSVNTAAQCNIVVGGTSAGPAWTQYTAGSSRAWAVGMNTASSQNFQITTNASGTVNPSTGTQILTATTAGNITLPSNAIFFAYLNATSPSQTGGTQYTIPFNATSFNRQTVFNTGTATFTAPVTGIYILSLVATTSVGSNTSTFTGLLINGATSPPSYYLPGCGTNLAGSGAGSGGSIVLSLNSGDTVKAFITVNGSGSFTVTGGTAPYASYFCGCLIS